MEAAIPNPPNTRIAVVTGGNKGIGLEVCRQLASAGITVVLTARDETRGAAAVEKIREAGLSDIIFHQLEITDAPSIARLAEFLKARFGKLDILVNNAAVGAVEYGQDPADSSPTREEKLINNEELKQELNDVEKLTEERLDEVLDTFLSDFKAGEVEARGWPKYFSAYKVSKVTMNAYTRILARMHPELRVNCAHPGYVSTDMTIQSGILTPEEGGSRVVRVALLPEGGITGAFFADGEEASFEVAVVTGGNKGIGLEVCRQLASNGITVVLTARDEARGAAAVEKLTESGLSHVIFHQLEVTDAQSIARLAGFLKERFGKLDILLFRNEQLKQELNDVEKLTEGRLDELLAMFLEDFEAGEAEARGWPMYFSAYKVAKAAMNAYSRILARKHPELRINCAHPGYVKTDLTLHSGLLTPEEGASNVVKVALLPEGAGPTGVFFALGLEAPFE
ncbi:hypothetical protein HU200_031495 [Digitaria exilis]|uniref:Uncharacterized protein n=1 Tax=Digitaria exilis TaxID=1010633 RepID=A0A835BLM9_9POAL|nr:hypothetical protein HU200_031495 [Digitaria exilis]